jgi:hypothetical protein
VSQQQQPPPLAPPPSQFCHVQIPQIQLNSQQLSSEHIEPCFSTKQSAPLLLSKTQPSPPSNSYQKCWPTFRMPDILFQAKCPPIACANSTQIASTKQWANSTLAISD